MPKYEIEWTTERWHRTTVEADTKELAWGVWVSSGLMFSDETVYEYDYVQDNSVEIEEVE